MIIIYIIFYLELSIFFLSISIVSSIKFFIKGIWIQYNVSYIYNKLKNDKI